jgi:hypothetical protein
LLPITGKLDIDRRCSTAIGTRSDCGWAGAIRYRSWTTKRRIFDDRQADNFRADNFGIILDDGSLPDPLVRPQIRDASGNSAATCVPRIPAEKNQDARFSLRHGPPHRPVAEREFPAPAAAGAAAAIFD